MGLRERCRDGTLTHADDLIFELSEQKTHTIKTLEIKKLRNLVYRLYDYAKGLEHGKGKEK